MTPEEWKEVLYYVNNEGAKGKRLVGFSDQGHTASGQFWDGLIFIFDTGGQNVIIKKLT